MTRYYDEIDSFERSGFTVIVDKSYEDLHPSDCFDDSSQTLKNSATTLSVVSWTGSCYVYASWLMSMSWHQSS
jgi:hypothetical protein